VIARLLLLVVVLAAGCATLPDVSPFASASRDLASAVRASGSAISGELHASPDVESQAKKFDDAWAARNLAMQAVVAYSDGLVGIVRATGEARASARSLADKLGALATAVNIAQPGAGAAIGVAADTGAFIWAQIALARGAESLDEALGHAQPAIDRLVEIIGRDTRDLARIVRAMAEAQRGALNKTYNTAMGYREVVEQEREKLRAKDFTGLVRSQSELKRAEELMALVSAEMQRYGEEKARIDAREKAGLLLVAATRDAMERWAAAHRDVALSLQNRRPVNVESLTAGAVELRTLVARIREL
jgi:hypothetical protein